MLLERYHSVYLTTDGNVFTCGHGRGGRLGLGHEEPKLVGLNKNIFIIANIIVNINIVIISYYVGLVQRTSYTVDA